MQIKGFSLKYQVALTRFTSPSDLPHLLGETWRAKLARKIVQCSRLILVNQSLEEKQQREIANLLVLHRLHDRLIELLLSLLFYSSVCFRLAHPLKKKERPDNSSSSSRCNYCNNISFILVNLNKLEISHTIFLLLAIATERTRVIASFPLGN